MISTPAGLFFTFGLPDAPVGDNPFTLVYNSIWNLLLSRPVFVANVKIRNRISFIPEASSGVTSQKDFNKLGADFPEVQIVIEGSSPHHNNTSDSSMIKRTYAVMVNTDTANIDALFALEWEIYQALAGWRTSVSALEYKNERFAKVLRNLPVTTGYTLQDQSSIRGWASVWRAEVEMHFSNVNLGV
jgi:hypothetical protein